MYAIRIFFSFFLFKKKCMALNRQGGKLGYASKYFLEIGTL